MIANIAKKELKDCEIVNYWANTIPIMRMLKKEDDLYLDELFLLSLIYRLYIEKGSHIRISAINRAFNVLSYKREKMIANLMNRGYIAHSGPERGFNQAYRIVVTALGEQLLIKYEKALRRLCNEV